MTIQIDPSADIPPFEQLRRRLLAQIASGDLAPGTRLPTVRRLAEDLGLAANTVARAYRELEADEAIETRGRAGSFVAESGDPTERQSRAAARGFVERIRSLGVADDAALELVKAALRG
jgi:DNA-binding transcriptional regulator YhcF (GntR family)